jgi:hypothetical protein
MLPLVLAAICFAGIHLGIRPGCSRGSPYCACRCRCETHSFCMQTSVCSPASVTRFFIRLIRNASTICRVRAATGLWCESQKHLKYAATCHIGPHASAAAAYITKNPLGSRKPSKCRNKPIYQLTLGRGTFLKFLRTEADSRQPELQCRKIF